VFSEYVKLGKITEQELLSRWEAFSTKLGELVEQAGVEFRDYSERHKRELGLELVSILKMESKGKRKG
jgi:hypothetical protein